MGWLFTPNRRLYAALALTITLLLPSLGLTEEEIGSPITGEFSIKFGEYAPSIDDAFDGNGPYAQMFDGGQFYFEADVEYYIWREVGAIGVGMAGGFFSADGFGINEDGSTSVDETSLSVVPLRANLSYHMDSLARELNVPLVIYIKGGLDYYLWWIESAAGVATYRDPTTNELDEGRGGTWGWHGTVGIQFLLDFLAPTMSRTFDARSGINNSYIFAEWLRSSVDDFGSEGSLDFSDTTFLFGLAFEF